MTSRIILVDLDGPLADFEGEFLRRWRTQFPDEFFVPIENRKTFFQRDDYPEHLREKMDAIVAASGFFLDLPIIRGGIDAVKEMSALGHKVFLCTSDIYTNMTGLADKRVWVQKYLGHELAKTMIFTRDKTMVRGAYLIDDKPIINGLMTPEWEHVIFDQPFNRTIADKRRIAIDWSNWKEIIPDL